MRTAAMSQLETDMSTAILENLPSTTSAMPQQRRESLDASSVDTLADTLEPNDACSEAVSHKMQLCRPGSPSFWAMNTQALNSSSARNGFPAKHQKYQAKKQKQNRTTCACRVKLESQSLTV